MSPQPESVMAWPQYAQADLEMAGTVYGPRVPREYLCYHAQQAAEKALKAVLILLGIRPPLSHDIRILLDLLPADLPRTPELLAARRLTDYATEGRYPRRRKPVTDAQYREALHLAEGVVQWAMQIAAGATSP